MLTYKVQWAKETELRKLRDQGKWCEGEGRKQWVQGGQASEEVTFEEDEQMAAKERVCQANAEDRCVYRYVGDCGGRAQRGVATGIARNRAMTKRSLARASEDAEVVAEVAECAGLEEAVPE